MGSIIQNKGRRVLGKDINATFNAPPYGWDTNAVRVGVAALVRNGAVKILVNKKTFTNPADRELIDALRVSKNFDKAELVLEVAEIAPEVLTETRSFLMNLTRKRGIDETPAALSEGAESFANSVLTKAATVNLWSGGSGLPLPHSFIDGEDIWSRIKDLSNPVHRVQEIHGNQTLLEDGSKSIEQHATFQTENGNQFIDLKNFITQAVVIEHLIEKDSALDKLLEAYKICFDSANFADKETWKQLQSLKAQAALELQSLIEGWRDEARRRLDKALAPLPEELKQRELGPGLEEDLSTPLRMLRDSLDGVTSPAKAAALLQQAETAIRNLGERIIAEISKKKEIPTTEREPHPTQRLRFNEITAVTRVSNEQEWDVLKEKMDLRVRELLKQGYDVELG